MILAESCLTLIEFQDQPAACPTFLLGKLGKTIVTRKTRRRPAMHLINHRNNTL
jgi:hypothetical protein